MGIDHFMMVLADFRKQEFEKFSQDDTNQAKICEFWNLYDELVANMNQK